VIAKHKAASGSFALWYLLAAARRGGGARHCRSQGSVSGGLGLLLLGGLWLYVYITYFEYFMIFFASAAAIAVIPLLVLGACNRLWRSNPARSSQRRSVIDMVEGAVAILAIAAGAGVAGWKLYADTRGHNPVPLQAAQASYQSLGPGSPPMQPVVQPSSAGTPPENAKALKGATVAHWHGHQSAKRQRGRSSRRGKTGPSF
jgi:hypothetical protein